MRSTILDITPFHEKTTLHQYFKEQLDFALFYGENLDALYDELTSTTDPIEITLRYPARPQGKMRDYLPRLLSVFQDAARENYNLTIRFEEAN